MTPGTRLLLISLATFVVGVASVSFAYGRYAAARYGPERTFDAAVAAGEGCVVTIGDSRMVEGVDRGSLERALAARGRFACVAPLAIGALKLPGQAVVLRRYLDARRPSAVVLGVSDGTLLPDEEASDPAAMVGNRAVELVWSNADERALFYPDASLRTLDARLRHSVLLQSSLGSYGSLAWISVQSFQDRLAGASEQQPANRFGRLDDMKALENTFRQGAAAQLSRWNERFEISPWFERIVRLTSERRVPLVVVSVPMRSGYRRVVNESPAAHRYRTWLVSELAKRPRTSYVDLSAVADDDEFMDGVHLGPQGADTFSERLADVLPSAVGSTRSDP
jgi:hypothetical protein